MIKLVLPLLVVVPFLKQMLEIGLSARKYASIKVDGKGELNGEVYC